MVIFPRHSERSRGIPWHSRRFFRGFPRLRFASLGMTQHSWQLFPHALGQQHLRHQQPASTHQTDRKEITVLLIFFHVYRRLLQLVDVVENLFERFSVSGPEKFAVGDFRDLSQTALIKFYAL